MPVPNHYLRQNHGTWSPRRLVFFDTETEVVPGNEPELQRLSLWQAEIVTRGPVWNDEPDISVLGGDTVDDIANALDQGCRGHPSTWAYAHNLAFDLVVTGLPVHMADRGWDITAFSFNDAAPWVKLRRGKSRLILADSYGWLPRPLAEVAKAVGRVKPPLPDSASDREALRYRCEQDVVILRTAMLELLEWWDRKQLGRWSITGPSSGWSVMRHRSPPKGMLIKPDEEGRQRDRQAVRGGRRDAWQIGKFNAGPYVELDFANAYPAVAAHLEVPVARGPVVPGHRLRDRHVAGPRWGACADVVVAVDRPRYPVTITGATWWPVGMFQTVLAGPELEMAIEAGEVLEVRSAQLHQMGGYLGQWGRWVLGVLHDPDPDVPEVARITAKGWSRSVIGKFTAQHGETVEKRPTWRQGWHVEEGWTNQRQSRMSLVSLAGTEHKVLPDKWSDNAYPAVVAWIESEVRRRLSTVLESLPTSSLITCHTDGIMIDPKRAATPAWLASQGITDTVTDVMAMTEWCRAMNDRLWPLELRVKGIYDTLQVLGPAQMHVDQTRRWSGVPRDAVETPEGTYVGRVWPKLPWQLAHGNGDGYRRPKVALPVSGNYVHRWVTDTTQVIPPVCTWTPEHGNRLLPTLPASYIDPSTLLSPQWQHPALRQVMRYS